MSDMSTICNVLHSASSNILHSHHVGNHVYNGCMSVKKRLRELIESSKKLSYRNVAEHAGLSDSLVHKYCTKEEQSITIETLRKIAEGNGISYRWLLHGDGEPFGPDNVTSIFDAIDDTQKPLALDILKRMANDNSA